MKALGLFLITVVVSLLMFPIRAWYRITTHGKMTVVKGILEAWGVVGSIPHWFVSRWGLEMGSPSSSSIGVGQLGGSVWASVILLSGVGVC